MRDRLPQPTCTSCEHNYYHDKRTSELKRGVRLQPFEHYCLGCKRPRLFRGRDPKHKIPLWCPRRKNPCELRVYGFKSADEWYLHEQLCKSFGKEIPPMSSRYAVRHEQKIELSAYDFWRRCETEPESGLLPEPIALHEVMEIDDGIKQHFFYKTKRGFRIVYGFNPVGADK